MQNTVDNSISELIVLLNNACYLMAYGITMELRKVGEEGINYVDCQLEKMGYEIHNNNGIWMANKKGGRN